MFAALPSVLWLPIRPRRSSAGFTLVELLVVMTMISLVALAMAGAMRTMGQTEARVDERLTRIEDFRLTNQFLKSVLGRVSLRKLEPPPPLGGNLYMFSPSADSLAWVGVMPAGHGASGRHTFRLSSESVQGKTSLVIRFAPLDGSAAFPDWNVADAHTLVSDITAFSISYLDGRQALPEWSQQWTIPDRLPSHVKLTIETARGGWPETVIALRALPAGSRSGGLFVIGGEQ